MRFKDFGLEVVTVERSSFDYSMTINKNFVTFSKGIVQVMNKNLKETLLHIMPEWKRGKRYKIEGIHIPEDKAFVFELSKFEELPDFRKK